MPISIDPTAFDGVGDPEVGGRNEMPWRKDYRYPESEDGPKWPVGEVSLVVLYAEEYRKRGMTEKDPPTSIKIALGVDGVPTSRGPLKLRFDTFIGLGAQLASREKLKNFVATFAPETLKSGGTLDPRCSEGWEVSATLSEEPDEYRPGELRPILVKFLSRIRKREVAAPTAAPAAALNDDGLPF